MRGEGFPEKSMPDAVYLLCIICLCTGCPLISSLFTDLGYHNPLGTRWEGVLREKDIADGVSLS